MKSIRTRPIRKLIADRGGATAIEYGLIVALIAIAIITALGGLGNEVAVSMTTVKDGIATGNAAG